jgi:hypothetical protein
LLDARDARSFITRWAEEQRAAGVRKVEASALAKLLSAKPKLGDHAKVLEVPLDYKAIGKLMDALGIERRKRRPKGESP